MTDTPTPPDLSALIALVARLEGATEGSRELDCDIAVLVDGFFVERRPYADPAYCTFDEVGVKRTPRGDGQMLVQRYTKSTDAALALIERKLLGQSWLILYRAMMDWRSHVEPDVSRLLPRVLCIALLRAL